jgi:signal transduction histidine kinase
MSRTRSQTFDAAVRIRDILAPPLRAGFEEHAEPRSSSRAAFWAAREGLVAGIEPHIEELPLARFIEEMKVSATLESQARHCEFTAACDPPDLAARADRQMLFSALSNVLQNAFKFTRPGTRVRLHAYGVGDRALIQVEDECGGLPAGNTEKLFQAFQQEGGDRSGVGLGLSIARRAVEACGGTIRVRDVPTQGCVFTIELPRCALRPRVSDRRGG